MPPREAGAEEEQPLRREVLGVRRELLDVPRIGLVLQPALRRQRGPEREQLLIAAVATGYRAWPRFRNYLLALDLRLVLAAQLWRVIGVAFLFALAFGQLPAGFAVPAGLGDLATGIAALAVVLSLGNRSLTRSRLYAFTALGVIDFLVADATGLPVTHVVSGPGSMSTRAYDGSSGDAAVDVHGWISKPAKLATQTSAGAPSKRPRASAVVAQALAWPLR